MSAPRAPQEVVDAAVIGVGAMGRHHARVYSELPNVNLVGVYDIDADNAETVAAEYGTQSIDHEALLASAEVVSIAVPTPHHYEAVRSCLEQGLHVLVEKPFVEDPAEGKDLARLAENRGLVLQIGHIERFNPATRVLTDIVPDLDIVAVDIQRLGPPLDRENSDSVVMDLMVHDLDILLSLIDSDVETMAALAGDERHVTAQFQFENGSIAELTASRLTQQKIRRLAVTAKSCRVNVDFISQTVEIHRRSLPEYVEADGDIRYRHESVVERPMVENGEPLKHELSAFLKAVREESDPIVTPEDALQVMHWVEEIERVALGSSKEIRPT